MDVMRLLGEINTRGTTVVVATHNTRLVREVGRRTIFLKGGRLVEDRA
jgi:cell division transport system ATP-binding protein